MRENMDHEMAAEPAVSPSKASPTPPPYTEDRAAVLARLPDLDRPEVGPRTSNGRASRWDAKRLINQPTSIKLLVGGGVLVVCVAIFPWLFSSESGSQSEGRAAPSWHPGVPAPDAEAAPAWEPSHGPVESAGGRPRVVEPAATEFDLEYDIPRPPDDEVASGPWGQSASRFQPSASRATAEWSDPFQPESGGPPHLMAPPEVRRSPGPVAESGGNVHNGYQAARPFPRYDRADLTEASRAASAQAQPNRPMALHDTASRPSAASPGVSPYGQPRPVQASQPPPRYGWSQPAAPFGGAAEPRAAGYGAAPPPAYGGGPYDASRPSVPSHGDWQPAAAPAEPGMARFEGHIATPPVRTMQ